MKFDILLGVFHLNDIEFPLRPVKINFHLVDLGLLELLLFDFLDVSLQLDDALLQLVTLLRQLRDLNLLSLVVLAQSDHIVLPAMLVMWVPGRPRVILGTTAGAETGDLGVLFCSLVEP